jgi:hypothetical protein
MFSIIRKFTLRRGSTTEVTRRLHESFVPLLHTLPGFRAYFLFDGRPDVLVSIRLFDSADQALASNELHQRGSGTTFSNSREGCPR